MLNNVEQCSHHIYFDQYISYMFMRNMFRNIERRYVRGNLTIIFATTILLLLSSSSLLAGNLQIPTTSLKKADAQQTTTTGAPSPTPGEVTPPEGGDTISYWSTISYTR